MFDRCPTQIASDRVQIRLLTEADLPQVYDLHRIDQVNEYLPYTTWTQYQDARDWYDRMHGLREKKLAQQYAIELLPSHTFIGTCLVFDFDAETSSVTVGYVLHPDYWGQGLMTEAAGAFVHALVTQLSLDRCYATVEANNVGSEKVLIKLGFELIEQMTENEVSLGRWRLRCA